MSDAPDLKAWSAALHAIVNELRAQDYPFASELQGYGPPLAPTSERAFRALERAEREIGPVPHLIWRIAKELGSVDLRHGRPHDPDAPLQELAEFDPLVFDLEYFAGELDEPGWIEDEQRAFDGAVRLEFAPDIYHKADISGGDGPAIWIAAEPVANPASLPQLPFDEDLPPPAIARETGPVLADFGLSLADYFEQTLRNGGFFGHYLPSNTGDAQKDLVAIARRDLGTDPALDRLRNIATKYLPD